MQASSEPLACFALLDDARADAAARSRLFETPHRTVRASLADDPARIREKLAEIEQALRDGAHVVWLSAYELGNVLHAIASPAHAQPQPAPLFIALLCDPPRRLDAAQTADWLQTRAEALQAACARPDDSNDSDAPAADAQTAAGILDARLNVDEAGFTAAIARIRDWCAAGDTYQVNYTCSVDFRAYGHPLRLYQRLRARQPVPYGALIHLPEEPAWQWILSCSPELFVARQGRQMRAQPMKGTASRNGGPEGGDENQRATALATDPKNRAENLMIVDLLRNDLGRIAEAGTVNVPELFKVTPHGEVLQMTSTIEATARPGLTLSDLLDAIYPCGSITGAPKRRTMELIAELEPRPRGLYTGALGWIEPPAPASSETLGDLMLAVPIRTAVLDRNGRGTLGVGAGITHSSRAEDEYAETRLKARFLTGMPPEFGIFETMRAEHGRIQMRDAHLQRLSRSARSLGIDVDRARIEALLDRALRQHAGEPLLRVRLALQANGETELSIAALTELRGPQRVCLAARALPVGDPLRGHKITARAAYDRAWRAAEKRGCFDALFFDEAGTLLEGGRSSVFLKLDGLWQTPALDAGVLPGILRAQALQRPGHREAERPLTLDDVRRAEGIALSNALRGWLPVTLVEQHV